MKRRRKEGRSKQADEAGPWFGGWTTSTALAGIIITPCRLRQRGVWRLPPVGGCAREDRVGAREGELMSGLFSLGGGAVVSFPVYGFKKLFHHRYCPHLHSLIRLFERGTHIIQMPVDSLFDGTETPRSTNASTSAELLLPSNRFQLEALVLLGVNIR